MVIYIQGRHLVCPKTWIRTFAQLSASENQAVPFALISPNLGHDTLVTEESHFLHLNT